MTFPTDWDVDKYRVEHECEDHWELRRSFLETHKDKFPEERLVCLAQVFYNVEFMGCRYPEKTMRLVAQLSNGVADDHREKMKTKLQRTFVQASDAASTKVKGRSGNVGTAPTAYSKGPIKFLKSSDPTESAESTEKNDHSTTNTINLNESNEDVQIVYEEDAPVVNTEKSTESSVNKKKKNRKKKKKTENGTLAAVDPPTIEIVEENDTEPILEEENPEDTSAQQAPKGKKKKSRGKKKKKNVEDATAAPESAPGRFVVADQSRFNNPRSQKRKDMNSDTAAQQSKRMKTSNPLSDFVLMEFSTTQGVSPYGILSRSAECSQKTLTQHVEQTPTGPKMTLALNGHTLATASGKNLDEAKAQCASTALQKLRQSCYTVTLKDRFAGSTVEKGSDPKPEETPHHLTDDSKANRMMKLMGWGGGGLGKDQQGRQEPVEVVQRIRRVGLGGSAGVQGPEFRNFILDVLKKYSTSDASHDLVFASDYSKEERAQIHVLAKRFHLKSASYGKDQNRRLVLSIKKTPQQILSEVLKAGGSTDKYEVTPPGNR